ncbi:MAG: xylose isomerase [Rhodopirellula sp.]|nr:xylose isomerase [Rhodopirellula sp.]
MLKNFSPAALGINGRQSELIELALTYGFTGMDVDMHEMLRRAQRTNVEDAAKYLEAAKIEVGGFELGVDLDADDDAFTSQLGALHPVADMAKQLGATRGYIRVPAATNRLPYHEYFEVQGTRLAQIAQVLEPRGIKLGIGFSAGKELEEGKEFAFVRNVEGFLALVNSVAGANVGMLLDTWDWVVGEGAMDQLSEIPAEKIVAVRLGSVNAEAEAGKATSSDRVLPEQEGALNHVSVIKHLDSIGFDGPVSPSASNQSYKGQTRESIVQRAQEAVDGISKEAGLTVAKLPMETIEDIPYEPNPIS